MVSSMPIGDKWELIDNDNTSLNFSKKYTINFSFIKEERIKQIIKFYVWRNFVEGRLVLSNIYSDVFRFKAFYNFMNIKNINDFKQLTNNFIEEYVSYLKVSLKNKNMKPLTYHTQRRYLDTIKSVIKWTQLYMTSEAPETSLFTGNEYPNLNKKLKIDFIPDDVLNKINLSLVDEDNLYLKYGVIILQTTGMRVGDLLKLKVDCMQPHLISGMLLSWYDHKARKERHPMPINATCAEAITKLIDYTDGIRKENNNKYKEYLFIHKIKVGRYFNETTIINGTTFNNWLKAFVVKNLITDSSGNLINLTTHKFRRTLATDMLSKGININVIQNVLGHSAPTTTSKYYADVKYKERAKKFRDLGIIGNIDSINELVIPNNEELEWFNKNKDKGARMCDGYCTKPFKEGQICDRLIKRQKCYTCSRYITTPAYLQVHKSHLEELERQLEGNIYGSHYAEHFLPTIEILKEIISRLEELQDGHREFAVTSDN